MITEDYVSFETAKLLKEKGFDEEYDVVYSEYGDLHKIFDKEFYENTNSFAAISNSNYNDITRFKYNFFVIAPTLQMAMKWLREVHNIFIFISFRFSYNADNDINFSYYAEKYGNYYGYGDGEFISYEQACEAAIKYCLENLI